MTKAMTISYEVGDNLYLNLTNKCPCNCVFCLRHTKEMQEGNNLWFKNGDPSLESVLQLFSERERLAREGVP